MIAEDLMRKYKYGYVHSCKLLEEPFIKTLLKENQLLKKQLEEANKKLYLCIKYLEDEIKSCEAVSDLLFNSNKEMKVYKEILQKYKEIIGVLDERKS